MSTIGELRFVQRGRPVTARLRSDLRWDCDDKDVEGLLNQSLALTATDGLEVHRPAIHNLYQAGERLGAQVCVTSR